MKLTFIKYQLGILKRKLLRAFHKDASDKYAGKKRKGKNQDKHRWRKVAVLSIPVVFIPVGFTVSAQSAWEIWLSVVAWILFFLYCVILLEWNIWGDQKRTQRVRLRTACGLLCVAVVGLGVFWTYKARDEPDKLLRGLLVPAYEPSPANPCRYAPDSAFFLYYGNSVTWTVNTGVTLNVIKFAGENVLSFERTPSGIVVNAIIRDEKGDEVATIKKNVFRARYGSEYDATSQDAHSILVLNSKDQVVLYVRYLNPQAVKVLGIFRRPNRPPITVNEDGITGYGTIRNMCAQGFSKEQVGINFE